MSRKPKRIRASLANLNKRKDRIGKLHLNNVNYHDQLNIEVNDDSHY